MRYNIVTNAETAFYRGGYRSLKCTISINYYNLSVTTGKNFSKTICFFFIWDLIDKLAQYIIFILNIIFIKNTTDTSK
jgi:hypothetical protein